MHVRHFPHPPVKNWDAPFSASANVWNKPSTLNPMKNSKRCTSLLIACGLAILAIPSAFAGDPDKKFKAMDADSDGKVTRTEHAVGAREMFTKCDANKDGLVTAAEMDAAFAAKGDKHDKHEKSAIDKIKEIDTNADGQLSLAEHEAGTEKMFNKLDKNSDGTLSKDECHEGHKEMKKDK